MLKNWNRMQKNLCHCGRDQRHTGRQRLTAKYSSRNIKRKLQH